MKIVFTGHRPDRLGGWNNQKAEDRLFDLAYKYLSTVPKSTIVIQGVAPGWDFASALAAIKHGMELWSAIPFKGQESRWSSEHKKTYHYILAHSVKVHTVSGGGFSKEKMMVRNRWMVDQLDKPEDRVIALWDGSPSGTGNCVRYASRKDVMITSLWNSWVKHSGIEIAR